MDIEALLQNLHRLDAAEQRDILRQLRALEEARQREGAQGDLLKFGSSVWDALGEDVPTFKPGHHHRVIADVFHRVADGKAKRVIINVPPRHGKSRLSSILFPAWYMGRNPRAKIAIASHTADLAIEFGGRIRDLVKSQEYRKIFPKVKLRADNSAAGKWRTEEGGEFFAVGVGGAFAGRGASICIVDDPISEKESKLAIHNPDIFDGVYDWFERGPRQRLNPGAALVVIMTRWHQRDLSGRLIKNMITKEGSDEWEVIQLPAILPSGDLLWPEHWSREEILALKNSIEPGVWSAVYQQNPTSEESAILKREWWKRWTKDKPPEVEFVIVSLDTANTANSRSDYSAFSVWGVFYKEDDDGGRVPNLILLNAFKERLEFPELKARAKAVFAEWKPDAFIIESKASGTSLIQEFRMAGIPVSDFTPTRATGDKVTRANAVTDLLASGVVWAPETRWADEVIEECGAFPVGEYDDMVDSVVMALTRYRNGGFVRLPSDYEDTEEMIPAKAEYY